MNTKLHCGAAGCAVVGRWAGLVAITLCLGLSQWAGAQQQAGAQADRSPAPQPPTEEKEATPVPEADTAQAPAEEPPAPLPAVVMEVSGSVDWAAAGASPLNNEGWTPVKEGDRLEPGVQLRTGLRSHVNLQFGETTTISIRSATHASIDQFYRSARTENVRIGLGYGTVRGGSSEGEVRADVIVDSPVATLAKRGTEGWEINVEAATGRFRISLSQYGLVEARQRLRGGGVRSKAVRPGEYVTDVNIANLWINQEIFDRNVTFYAPEWISEADAEFAARNPQGYGVVASGGGTALVDTTGKLSAGDILRQTAADLPPGVAPPSTAIGRPVSRPDGNFGTGRTFRAARR